MKTIAIIGFGFCGRMAFYHLVKSAEKKRIIIFDKNGPEALGPAFSRFSQHYILNVPTIKMSAFSNKPRDFCDFLEQNHPQVFSQIGDNGFAPRWLYGEYLKSLTEEAFANARKNGIEVEFVSEEVLQILDDGVGGAIFPHRHPEPCPEPCRRIVSGSFKIRASSNNYDANEILLATSFSQSDLPFELPAKNVVKKLWNLEAKIFHEKNFSEEKICLIGTGLTAVDVIVGLKNKNFSGKILVVSRRGNFPKKHFSSTQKTEEFIKPDDARAGVLALCLKTRKFLKENPQFDLRHAIDSLRHITTALWQNFDEKNKKLFLRFLPYWNIFRHRAPAQSIELIEQMIESGQLEVRKRKDVANGSCDWLVNCLGFEFNAKKYPLLSQMIESGLLKKDLLLAQSNNPQIHLLGGLNVGHDFECTAVPDLRVSVERIFEKK